MDPNANLREQRQLAAWLINESSTDARLVADRAERLAELVQAMDEWLCSGGFLPELWSELRDTPAVPGLRGEE